MTNIAPLARGAHRPADAVDDVLDVATAVELARERLHEARAVYAATTPSRTATGENSTTSRMFQCTD